MAAQNGTLTLVGASGRVYTVDCYLPDAAGNQWTFNPNGAAASTSPNTYRIPENCVIYDFSVAASPTATGSVFYNNSGAITGGVIRHANQLNTLANRQKLKIPLRSGDIISAIEFA